MIKLKRIIVVVLAALMLVACFACDTKQKETGILDDGYVPEISGKLSVYARSDVYTTESARRGVRNWVNNFMTKYPDVNIECEFISYDLYFSLISSKSMADVYFLDDGSLYQFAITNNALMPLDYYIEALNVDISSIYSGIYNLGVCEGKVYMAGMSCGQQSFIYNVDMLQEIGYLQEGERIANDWTWDDFKEIAARLKQTNDDGTIARMATMFPVGWSPFFSSFFVSQGGKWVDTENKQIHLYDDEKVREGFGELINAVDNRWVYPTEVSMGAAISSELSKINQDQDICFRHLSSYSTATAVAANFDQAGIEWDFAPYFLFDYAASPCGTLGFGVFSYTRNRDAAAALVLSLYTEDGQWAIHSQEGGDVPVIKTLGEQDFWHLNIDGWEDKNYDSFIANYDKYITSHVKAQVPPEIAEIIESGMKTLWANHLSNKKSWEDSLNEIQTKCNELWSTMK